MKNFPRFLAGIAVTFVGIIILLMNITVVSFGFLMLWGAVDASMVLLIILVGLAIWAFQTDNILPDILMAVDVLLIILSVLLGTHLVFKPINALTLILILGMIGVGLGLIVSSFFKKK